MPRQTDARAHYLAIAAARFAAAGFHGVSLAEIAKDAGVTKQALLHFFSTKERLYADVLSGLAARLLDALAAAEGATPEETLAAYFNGLAAGALADPSDARLVVRALLDSDPAAKMWPMKRYLDELVSMALKTAKWRNAERAEILVSLYQLIGAIQYFAISANALAGMYGEATRDRLSGAFESQVNDAVQSFTGAD